MNNCLRLISTVNFVQANGGYSNANVFPKTEFEIKRQPSEYVAPVSFKSKKKSKPSKVKISSVEEIIQDDAGYEVPDGVQGFPLDEDHIPITSSHSLKLPAEYDEVMRSPVDGTNPFINTNNNYTYLDEATTSPSSIYSMLLFTQPSPQTMKVQTLATPTSRECNYEVPEDAQTRANTLPVDINGDYEVPLDASLKI